MFYLFIFEFLGTTELMVILVVALVLFGPRRLPQLSRSLGKSLSEFKRASEEFKQTWEREVALESVERERQIESAMLPPEENSILGPTVGREKVGPTSGASVTMTDETNAQANITMAPVNESATASFIPAAAEEGQAPEPTRKRDWL